MQAFQLKALYNIHENAMPQRDGNLLRRGHLVLVGNMDIVENFDTSKFYLGVLCLRNHNWGSTDKTLRYISNGACYKCKIAQDRARHEKHREEFNQKRTERYRQALEENPEEFRRKQAEYYKQNQVANRQKGIRYYRQNQQARIEYAAKYREENKESIRLKSQQRRQTLEGQLKEKRRGARTRARAKGVFIGSYTHIDLQSRFDQFSNSCAYCGAKSDLHIDHVISLTKGGADSIENIVPACYRCNYNKNNKDALTWYKTKQFYSPERWQQIVSILEGSQDEVVTMTEFSSLKFWQWDKEHQTLIPILNTPTNWRISLDNINPKDSWSVLDWICQASNKIWLSDAHVRELIEFMADRYHYAARGDDS